MTPFIASPIAKVAENIFARHPSPLKTGGNVQAANLNLLHRLDMLLK